MDIIVITIKIRINVRREMPIEVKRPNIINGSQNFKRKRSDIKDGCER